MPSQQQQDTSKNTANLLATMSATVVEEPKLPQVGFQVAAVAKRNESSSSSSSVVVPLPTRMALSAVAGLGAATVCHPLDVLRVQMQVLQYRSSFDAAKAVYLEAGLVNGLYAGVSASYLRQILYGSVRMGMYSFLVDQVRAQQPSSPITLPQKLVLGCLSGGLGSFIGTPADVALVRMSADSKLPLDQRRNYTSVANCLGRIVRDEGWTVLWTGALPTVLRGMLMSGTLMSVTSEAKLQLTQTGYFGPDGQVGGGYPLIVSSSLLSSLVANVVTIPVDVLKSRMQNDGQGQYRGMVDCLKQSVRREGAMVLWKGFTPAFIKLAPFSIISLTLLDKLTKAVTGKDAL